MSLRRFDELATRLIDAEVRPCHVRRLVRELSDHRDDLAEALVGAGADTLTAASLASRRLGSDDEIYWATLAADPPRSALRRHPFVMFLITPVPAASALLVVWAITGVALFDTARSAGWIGVDGAGVDRVAAALYFVARHLLIPALAAAIAVSACRARCAARWSILAAASLSIFAGVITLGYSTPTGTSRIGSMSVGLTHAVDWRVVLVPFVAVMAARAVHRFAGGVVVHQSLTAVSSPALGRESQETRD